MELKMLVFFMILASVMSGTATAATLNVGQGRTYTTIQSAIDVAKTGDTIQVDEGVYNENPLIKTNGISVVGKDKENTIIEGKKTSSGIRIDEVNNVIISGFTIRNSGGGAQEDAGVTIYKATNNIVSNLILLSNSVGVSIYQGSNNNVISGNDMESSSRYGIYLYASNDNKIFDNNIKSNKFGLYAFSARTNTIYSNNFIDNGDQAYDNSGLNAWDFEKTGNYWSELKGANEYIIKQGGKNAKDSFPATSAFSINTQPVPAQPQGKEAGKSTPGFTVIASVISIIVMVMLRERN